MKHLRFFALLTGVLLAAGCDTSFEAFEETDLAYSVFGVLDAAADTQFVRVGPVRDSTFVGSSGDIGARVTSTNLTTGETVVWEEGVFRLGTDDSLRVHTFTTTADLAPETTYRFTVEREEGGATSVAEVTLPPAFPPPAIRNAPDRREGSEEEGQTGALTLLVDGVERLGSVRADYEYEACFPVPDNPPECSRQQAVAYHLADTTRRPDGTLEIEIPWQQDIPRQVGATLQTFYSFRVTVAAASEDWPDYAADNPPGSGPEGQPLPPPRVGTNVEGGTGFLGGVFTRTVDVPILR